MAPDFDIEQIQDFLEGLSTKHKQVLHSNEQRCFVRFQSAEHMTEVKNRGGKNLVIVAAIGGRRVGHKDDRQIRREMVIRFACLAEKNTDPVAAKRQALASAEKIMMDFFTKMERQQEEDLDQDNYGVMHYLDPENVSWEEIEDQPWFINHYGWDLIVPFRTFMPGYDEDSWNA